MGWICPGRKHAAGRQPHGQNKQCQNQESHSVSSASVRPARPIQPAGHRPCPSPAPSKRVCESRGGCRQGPTRGLRGLRDQGVRVGAGDRLEAAGDVGAISVRRGRWCGSGISAAGRQPHGQNKQCQNQESHSVSSASVRPARPIQPAGIGPAQAQAPSKRVCEK